MSVPSLIQHNIAYLDQAAGLVGGLGDEHYTESRDPHFSSSIGDHLRHVLEHYQCLLEGLPEAAIDYDARRRDRTISMDRVIARETIRAISAQLRTLPTADVALRVRLDGSRDGSDGDPWSTSTLKRELQYLQAHTVHHFALIAFILRLQGNEPAPGFGMAPSTLRHHASASSEDPVGTA